MAEINFSFKGVETKIAIRTNENRGNLLSELFLSRTGLKNSDNIPYLNDDNNKSINRKLTFIDKKNKISNMKKKENDNIIISNDFICPECKENILINIKDFKIDLYGCKNNHKFNNQRNKLKY